ncbi:MAG: hypothetical protein AAF602_16015, partial [Myxococcota bacterium]
MRAWMLVAIGCTTDAADEGPADPIEPVPRGDGVDVVIEEHDCFSTTATDDLVLGGELNRTAYQGYDASGPELVPVYEISDREADGLWDSRQRWTYDENGFLERYVSDLQWPRSESYVNDERGNVLVHVRDDDGDAVVDSETRYTYDANDEVLTVLQDADGDGEFEWRTEHDRDPDGRLVQSRQYVDDVLVETSVPTYDALGRRTELAVDRDLSVPGVELRVTRVWIEDVVPHFVDLTDEGDDGTVDWAWLQVLDEAGRLVRREIDHDADGKPDDIYTQTFDEAGRPLRGSAGNRDEGWGTEWSTTYDHRGRPDVQMFRSLFDRV